MNNKLSKNLLVSTLALSILAGATGVSAADGGEKITNGIITFEEDTSITPPVNPEDPDPEKPVTPIDPTDPEKPIDPENPGGGTAGPLSIDFASSFDFGKQKISVKEETYFADVQRYSDGTSGPNYVQVTDKRGTAAGWSLSVTQLEQFKAGENMLAGAELTLGNQGLNSVVGDAYKPTIKNVSQTLVPGEKTDLVSADVNKGMGTWLLYFGEQKETDAVITADGAKSVSLKVPGAAIKLKDMKYSTQLNWVLTDAPTA